MSVLTKLMNTYCPLYNQLDTKKSLLQCNKWAFVINAFLFYCEQRDLNKHMSHVGL